jgi:transposase-like protein
LVLASLRGPKTITELCREHDISDGLLRKWREQFLAAGAERLSGKAERTETTSCAARARGSSARSGERRWGWRSRGSSREGHERRLTVVATSALAGVRRLKEADRGVRGDRLGDAARGLVRRRRGRSAAR